MAKLKDITGRKFGRWTIIKYKSKNEKGQHLWHCKCDCGNEKYIQTYTLTHGSSRSCGCLKKEINLQQGLLRRKHTLSHTAFYHRFFAILERCNNPKNPNYSRYGERGIKCLWKNFKEYKTDMYESYLEHNKQFGGRQTSIDRIDNDGNYCKENCRWATCKEQCLNTRVNKKVIYKEKEYSLFDFCKKFNLNQTKTYLKLYNNIWTTDEIVKGVHIRKKCLHRKKYPISIQTKQKEAIYNEFFSYISPDSLSAREEKILEFRFKDFHTLDETALKFGITRERIRQIENKALEKLISLA